MLSHTTWCLFSAISGMLHKTVGSKTCWCRAKVFDAGEYFLVMHSIRSDSSMFEIVSIVAAFRYYDTSHCANERLTVKSNLLCTAVLLHLLLV
jgi:acetylornithine deacetylase/succinyl-diaminopimelate desuccinylase-like protein